MLIVTFLGKAAVPSPAVGTGYSIWSYQVSSNGPGASGGGDLPAGVQVALGMPATVDVKGQESYPALPQLQGISIQRDQTSTRQYAVRQATAPGTQTISFVAPSTDSSYELLLAKAPTGQALAPVPYMTNTNSAPQILQLLPAPAVGAPVSNGRPLSDFAGTLPYSSEVFGVFQPLAGWYGLQSALRAARGSGDAALAGLGRQAFSGESARALEGDALAALASRFETAIPGVLSPVGLVNLFRQYFFEFDTFLGPPAGHLWISPGGTVEVIETSTRRTLVEQTAEQSTEESRKAEESLTSQDDLADAVKEDHANDTKLGVGASAGGSAAVFHAEASASFNTSTTVKTSSEQTHKHSRAQSSKASSEIRRNFKTTFKTVTESTDTTSRRYVVQNTTDKLVNYELRRKMRKVGVQLQHIGSRLCWQVYLDGPGRDLGMGDLIHVVAAPDLSGLKKPDPPPPLEVKITEFTGPFPIRKTPGTPNDIPINEDFPFPSVTSEGIHEIISYNFNDHMVSTAEFTADPPAPGFTLVGVALKAAKSGGGDTKFIAHDPITILNADTGRFGVMADFLNSGDAHLAQLTFSLTWKPPATDPAHDQYQADLEAYNQQVTQVQRDGFANAVRDRLKLVSSMRQRPFEDLRNEERQSVFGRLIGQLELFQDAHLGSELIRQIFDVDEMLYFMAPDYWRPTTVGAAAAPPPRPHPNKDSRGRYPIPEPPSLDGLTVAGWYSRTDVDNALDPVGQATLEWRVDYAITEETQPAPMGSSLGWLIQIDGDARRNEFLNAAWAKAVLPVRPGREEEALAWLAQAQVEGEAALGQPYVAQPGDPTSYQGKKVGEVLQLLTADLRTTNADMSNELATEKAFETGFDPLAGGFRDADPYQIFDQWVEVLPTDQVVAVQVSYDPKTGQQQ
ncbi:hypothetical protein ABZW30_45585 [Kitasatospora sp. NPDC004669]|uniref:hypothetical protein n=1 Tax=Kitasatospora sp. NPDC004669 TaxID=3154555 RepID=UPI0033B12589